MSRNVYGRQCGGTTARNILSFSSFEKVAAILFHGVMFFISCMFVVQICAQILDERFAGITKIRCVWDFKTFLQHVRPRSASKGIQTKFSLQFQVAEDGSKIMCRHKGAVDVRVQFGPWQVMLPHPKRPDAIPHRDAVPPVCEAREWPEFEAWIVPTLRMFYNDEFEHPVHIPDADKEEMLAFLTRGPDPPAPPGWIAWDDAEVDADAVAGAGAGTGADADAGARAGADAGAEARAGAGAGAGAGAEARAGAGAGAGTGAGAGADAGARAGADAGAGAEARAGADAGAGAGAAEFPFPVGTWVAFEFSNGTYTGRISKVWNADLCKVDFADGDTADYDGDEIHYAAQLYQRDFTGCE